MTIKVSKDDEAFKQLVRISTPARSFRDWTIARQRVPRELSVKLLCDQADLERADVVALFKVFEFLGYGRFIIGKNGHESRIKWSAEINVRTMATKASAA